MKSKLMDQFEPAPIPEALDPLQDFRVGLKLAVYMIAFGVGLVLICLAVTIP